MFPDVSWCFQKILEKSRNIQKKIEKCWIHVVLGGSFDFSDGRQAMKSQISRTNCIHRFLSGGELSNAEKMEENRPETVSLHFWELKDRYLCSLGWTNARSQYISVILSNSQYSSILFG